MGFFEYKLTFSNAVLRSMEKLQALNNEKLIKVVKNYHQYGYDLETRKAAIELLKVRGISQDTLQMTGNFDNDTYNRALSSYHSFLNKTRVALVSYVLLLFCDWVRLSSIPIMK